MGRKRVIAGQSEWGIGEDDVKQTIVSIETALKEGGVADLQLLNAAGRPIRVFLNCKAVESVVIDLDSDPKPSEISV